MSALLELAEMRAQWLFNLELECSGASLSELEAIAVGGAVLKIRDLLAVLQEADKAAATIHALREALEPFGTEFAGTFVDSEGWKGPMNKERIVDWFGPSDFRRAQAVLSTTSATGRVG